MFGQSKRTDIADTITAGARAIGETSQVVKAILGLAVLALIIAVAALVVATRRVHPS